MALALRPQNYGSVVREPVYEPEKIRQAKDRYVYEAEVQIHAQVAKEVKVNRELTLKQALLLTLSISAAVLVFFFYILTLSTYGETKKTMENMQREYATLVSENALLANKVESGINYDEVYRYATEMLGMQAPGKQQIITYGHANQTYVTKQGSIPNE